ncbi:MAG: DUF3035 domain-containing protein, partial [Elioraea tepidiphila]
MTSRLLLVSVLAAPLLAACGGDTARTFGFTRDPPDEFQVQTQAPLSMPPEFGLRPPRPGAPRPQEMAARDAAQGLLVARTVTGTVPLAPRAGVSAGEAALLAARSGKREITQHELEEGIMRVIAGPEKKTRVMGEKERL